MTLLLLLGIFFVLYVGGVLFACFLCALILWNLGLLIARAFGWRPPQQEEEPYPPYSESEKLRML